jgi:hypothetical protein
VTLVENANEGIDWVSVDPFKILSYSLAANFENLGFFRGCLETASI